MVRCFLIHTVCPVGALGPGDSRVLYSRLFGPNEAAFSEQHRELEEEERRLLQKEAVALVARWAPASASFKRGSTGLFLSVTVTGGSAGARQVRSAVRLSREASGRPLGESEPGEEALALQEADGGVRRLRAGEPFCGETSALWLAVHGLAFTLVCEAHENLLLAEGSLRSLSRHCLEQLHLLGPGPEVSRDRRGQPGNWCRFSPDANKREAAEVSVPPAQPAECWLLWLLVFLESSGKSSSLQRHQDDAGEEERFWGRNRDGPEGGDGSVTAGGKVPVRSCSSAVPPLFPAVTALSLQVLLRSDRVDALLDRLLPHGQLLFLNHRFAQSLEKEAAAYASK